MTTHDIVFLFDIDNTLVDNDHVQADLKHHLAATYGPEARDRYWEILVDRSAIKGQAVGLSWCIIRESKGAVGSSILRTTAWNCVPL